MILSLLKIGLLSVAFAFPFSKVATSSNYDHVATIEEKAPIKNVSYSTSYTIQSTYFRLKDINSLGVPSSDNYFHINIGENGEIKSYQLTYSLVFKYDIDSIIFGTYSFGYALYAIAPGNVRYDICAYNTSTNQWIEASYFNDFNVLKIENCISPIGDVEDINFFTEENFEFRFNGNANFGQMLGSSTFVIPNNNYIVESGNLSDGTIHFYQGVALHKMAQGLFYCIDDNKFYCSIGYTLINITNSKVQTDKGIQNITNDCVMVCGLYLANNFDSDFEYFDSNEVYYLGMCDFAIYDNENIATSHYTFKHNEFVSIGTTMPDVENYNYLVGAYDYYLPSIFENLNASSGVVPFESVTTSSNNVTSGNLLDNVFTLMGSGMSRLFGFLDITLLPGITVGTMLFIPFAVTIMLFIVKLFKR